MLARRSSALPPRAQLVTVFQVPLSPVGVEKKVPLSWSEVRRPSKFKRLGAVWHLEHDMVAANKALDRRGAVAGLMNHHLAVQEAVGLRAQTQLQRDVGRPRQSVDSSGGERRNVDRSGAAAAGHARRAAERGRIGLRVVCQHAKILLRYFLSVEIEIDRVLPGQKCAAGRVTDSSAEGRAPRGGRHDADIVDAAQGMAVGRDICGVDPVLAGVEVVKPILEGYAPVRRTAPWTR